MYKVFLLQNITYKVNFLFFFLIAKIATSITTDTAIAAMITETTTTTVDTVNNQAIKFSQN